MAAMQVSIPYWALVYVPILVTISTIAFTPRCARVCPPTHSPCLWLSAKVSALLAYCFLLGTASHSRPECHKGIKKVDPSAVSVCWQVLAIRHPLRPLRECHEHREDQRHDLGAPGPLDIALLGGHAEAGQLGEAEQDPLAWAAGQAPCFGQPASPGSCCPCKTPWKGSQQVSPATNPVHLQMQRSLRILQLFAYLLQYHLI